MAKGPEPQQVHGVYWREDREAWAARYKINGKLIRKVFGPNPVDRQSAIDWLEDARSLKRKEGAGAPPKTFLRRWSRSPYSAMPQSSS